MRREHVEHYIETLDDRDLAKQLTLLRLDDANDMEETLRAYQRMENRQGKTSMGLNRFRQRSTITPDHAASKPARAVRAISTETDSSGSDYESAGSGSEIDLRRVCVAATHDQVKKPREDRDRQRSGDRKDGPDRGDPPRACSHCGSIKHDDRGC